MTSGPETTGGRGSQTGLQWTDKTVLRLPNIFKCPELERLPVFSSCQIVRPFRPSGIGHQDGIVDTLFMSPQLHRYTSLTMQIHNVNCLLMLSLATFCTTARRIMILIVLSSCRAINMSLDYAKMVRILAERVSILLRTRQTNDHHHTDTHTHTHMCTQARVYCSI